MMFQLPAFVLAVGLLFWSFPVAVFVGFMPLLNKNGKRSDGFGWANYLKTVFGIQTYRLGLRQLYTATPCVYLCNHRSWADFFLDTYLTTGHGQLMGRMMVALAFPCFMGAVAILKTGIIFKRVTLSDKEKFNKWIDRLLRESPIKGLLVYPEGHRNTRPGSLPLKRGMLRYAYTRQMPIQLVMTLNKEHVMSEKKKLARFGQVVLTSYSEVLLPQQFESFEDFMDGLQRLWDEEWNKLYQPVGPAVVYENRLVATDFPYSAKYPLLMIAHFVLCTSALAGSCFAVLVLAKLAAALVGMAAVLMFVLTCALALPISILSNPAVPLHPCFQLASGKDVNHLSHSNGTVGMNGHTTGSESAGQTFSQTAGQDGQTAGQDGQTEGLTGADRVLHTLAEKSEVLNQRANATKPLGEATGLLNGHVDGVVENGGVGKLLKGE